MADPVRRGGTAAVSGLTTSSPSSTAVGDLVVVFTFERLGVGSASTLTLHSSMQRELCNHFHNDGSTDGSLGVACKIATAAGTQSYQGFTSSDGTATWTGCEVVQFGTYDQILANIKVATPATQTTNAVPNPPQVSSLDSARAHYVAAIAAWHLGSAATVTPTVPSSYSNLTHISGSATAELACSSRILASGASSEDPGTYGDDVAPNGTCSFTLAVQGSDNCAFSSDGAAIQTMAGTARTVPEVIAAGVNGLARSPVPPLVDPVRKQWPQLFFAFEETVAVTGSAISADGAGVQTMTGAALADAPISSDGAGLQAMAGASFAEAPISADGAALLTLAGAAAVEAPISLTGSALVSMDGASLGAAPISSDGAATQTMSSESIAAFDLSMDGAATATFESDAQAGAEVMPEIIAAGVVGTIRQPMPPLSQRGLRSVPQLYFAFEEAPSTQGAISSDGTALLTFAGEAVGETFVGIPPLVVADTFWQTRKPIARTREEPKGGEVLFFFESLDSDIAMDGVANMTLASAAIAAANASMTGEASGQFVGSTTTAEVAVRRSTLAKKKKRDKLEEIRLDDDEVIEILARMLPVTITDRTVH